MQEVQRTQYVPPRDKMRWWAVKNCAGETIPGFALIALRMNDPAEGGNGDYFTQRVSDGQVVWNGYKPDEETEYFQLATMLLVNGPTPIPVGKVGKATNDWPCQVLHDGGVDSLPNGHRCGPRAGKWEMYSTGTAFICMSHDRAEAAGKTRVHTVWVCAESRAMPTFSAGTASQIVIASNQPVLPQAVASKGNALAINADGFTARRPGYYDISFSATVTSPDVLEGGVLRLRAYKNNEATYIQAYRTMAIEDDLSYQTPFRTSENIACRGVLELDTGDVLQIRNDSGTTIYATAFCYTVSQLVENRVVPSADGFTWNP